MAIPIPKKRISDFEKLGFGMFIHWGLYSQLGKGEWIMHINKIPKNDYCKLIDTFTASKFDARKIAKTAKNAGMKYITLTTRHHEGFSLFDTKGLSKYDVMHSPCGRDLIAEYVGACNDEGIVPFFYHTTLDWYQDSFNHDFKAYLEYLRQSVELLCTNYGKIGGLWFDGNWSKPDEDWEEDKLYETIRKHQPDAMIINNTGLSHKGEVGNKYIDSVTFEQGRPTPLNREGMPKYIASEMCQTINAHWGIGSIDFNYKSLPYLIESLCACRKVGANYLLNVGPTGEGEILKLQEALLEGIGEWVSVCGSSIYTGKPCPIQGTNKNFALRDPDTDKVYLYVHDLSTTGDSNVIAEGGGTGLKSFTRIDGKVQSVKWTDNDEILDFMQIGNQLYINCTGYEYGKNLVVRVAEVVFV
ncbi:MAG: alpha-L-fucosidase [Eubacteriales bacterium]